MVCSVMTPKTWVSERKHFVFVCLFICVFICLFVFLSFVCVFALFCFCLFVHLFVFHTPKGKQVIWIRYKKTTFFLQNPSLNSFFTVSALGTPVTFMFEYPSPDLL